MAPRTIPSQNRLFIARADWRNADQYPRPSLRDPSIWSWELLRRHNEYAHDYARFRERYSDVPATPYSKDSLRNYVCDPLPDDPVATYASYSKRHPEHFVCPVKDYVRKKWGINSLIDPTKDFAAIIDRGQIHDQHNKLAWLFACNTVAILNPPSNALVNRHYITNATGACTADEVLIRLSLTGNLDEQIESLRRQIARFYHTGNRSGALISQQHSDPGKARTAQYSDRHGRPIDTANTTSLDSSLIEINQGWNRLPARQKTLHYIVRMADAIATMEEGKLDAQLKAAGINADGLHINADNISEPVHLFYPLEHESLYPRMSIALAQFFSQQQLDDNAPDISAKGIQKWLFLAGELVGGGYQLIARTNARL